MLRSEPDILTTNHAERINALNTSFLSQRPILKAYAWVVILWERLWPLLVPFFTLALTFLIFSWLGGWRASWLTGHSTALFWTVRIFFLGGLFASLIPLRKLIFPTQSDILRQVEKRSNLDNRPLTALNDPVATGGEDAFGQALWNEHQNRMKEQLKDLSAGAPEANGARFDPLLMRAILPLIAVGALFFSFSGNGGRIIDFYETPTIHSTLPVRMDAWITPPEYTRKPPIFLSGKSVKNPIQKTVSVPTGSEFFLRFIGEGDVVVEIGNGQQTTLLEANSQEDKSSLTQSDYVSKLVENGTIRVKQNGTQIAEWQVSLIPDRVPEVEFVEPPSAALSGSLQLTYSVEDDYGVVEGEVDIESLENRDRIARPLIGKPEIKLELPRSRGKKSIASMTKDVTDHPWAGSKIAIRLRVKDGLGQTGETLVHEMTLPGRHFTDPLALALIEQRKILALDANQRFHVANLLDAVSSAAPEYIDNDGALIAMRAAYRRLVDARNDDQLRSVLGLLWDIALGVEFGNLSDVERRLREAQEQLSEALKNGANQEEIEQLMKELREAMQQMMQALAEEARKNPQAQNPFDQNDSQTLSQRDLENMMDRIEDLAKSGSQDAARQLLSEMQRMMENLQSGGQEQQAGGNELNEALDELSELMQKQQELMNETFRMQREQQKGLQQEQQQGQQGQQQQGQQGRQQNQQQQGQQGQQGNGPGEPMTPDELANALEQLQQQQEALEQQLGELGQKLEGLGVEKPEGFGEAEGEMGEAGENLGGKNPGSASTNQGNALQALRQGAQDIMQQMAGQGQQEGDQQGQQGNGRRVVGKGGRDPLGRDSQNDSLQSDSDVKIPDEIDAARARRILEAIRDRLAIPDNPVLEKDYLERLLKGN